MNTYPVAAAVDYQPEQSRLTTFFRAILVIPHLIWITLYGIVAYFAIIVAWFAIVFTGKYPEGLYNFVAGFNRLLAQFSAYYYILSDRFPPFGGDSTDYPVRVGYAGPLPEYSRAKTFFRIILELPLLILRYYVIGPLLGLGAIAAWFVVLITGKLPRGLHDLMAQGLVYSIRSDAYFALLTETYPPFVDPGEATGELAGSGGAQIAPQPPAPGTAVTDPAAGTQAPPPPPPAS